MRAVRTFLVILCVLLWVGNDSRARLFISIYEIEERLSDMEAMSTQNRRAGWREVICPKIGEFIQKHALEVKEIDYHGA